MSTGPMNDNRNFNIRYYYKDFFKGTLLVIFYIIMLPLKYLSINKYSVSITYNQYIYIYLNHHKQLKISGEFHLPIAMLADFL